MSRMGILMASFLLSLWVTTQYLFHEGKVPMPEFIVAIDHITYYAVQAKNEITAIDLALEGQGLEIESETRDAYISTFESSESHPRM
jgi:hypothetical protein